MKKKLFAGFLILVLALSAMSLTAAGEADVPGDGAIPAGFTVVLHENFDDYGAEADVKVSRLRDYFTTEANAIGDGYIRIQENDQNGNLHLKSHVFTQTHLTRGLTEGYAFSADIFQVQGDKQCTLFLRAPATKSAYYEADGHDGSSCCQSGINLYFRADALEVNVQSYDAAEPMGIKHNLFLFALPEGVHFGDGEHYTTFTAVDDNETIRLYVEGVHLATLTMEEGKRGSFGDLGINDPCFQKITVSDASGGERGVVENTLVSSKQAVVGWATRVADMIVDNVVLALPTDSLPTEPETVPTTEPVTEAPTAPVTEAGTNAEPGTGADTDPGFDTAVDPTGGTERGTGADTDGDAPAGETTVVIGGDIIVCVLVAVMLIALGGAAGYITVKTRK